MTKYTKLMGILNVTPDSFFDGGKYVSIVAAVERGLQIEKEGGDWIDIGGESTRPNAIPISEEEELRRVIPVIQELKKNVKIPISIDTFKPVVAEAAIKAGASLINDVSGFSHPAMIEIAKEYGVLTCVMHMQGNPQTMQVNPLYPKGVTLEILEWFQRKCDELITKGIEKSQIIFDPGIGFGKNVDQNLEIIQNLPQFKKMSFPLLLGFSRKSFMTKILKKNREDLLPATLALASFATLNKVDYLRVHDVGSHYDAINILHSFNT